MTNGAPGADDSGDAAATLATNAAIAPVLFVPVIDVDDGGDEVAALCARVELPASGREAGGRADVEAALNDELPGAVGRGGAFAAGGGEAAGAGRAGGTVGIADLAIGLLVVAARALVLVLLLGAAGLEVDGFLAAAGAGVGDAEEAGDVPAGDVDCLPVDDPDWVPGDDATAAGFIAAAGRTVDAGAAVALAGRGLGAEELVRLADVGEPAGAADVLAAVVDDDASGEAAAPDLDAVAPDCVLAPGRVDAPVLDWVDAPVPISAGGLGSDSPDTAEPPVAGEADSEEAAAAGVGLRALERTDAASAAADDVGSSDGVVFRVADAVLVADALLGVDEPAAAEEGPEDGVPVEAGAAGGAIQIPDSEASRVGCAEDPDVEPVLAVVVGDGREPESEVEELVGFEPGSDGAVDVPGAAGVVELAVEGFDDAPTTGGIPKPAGDVGFTGAGAPSPAESVSNGPSGSNN